MAVVFDAQAGHSTTGALHQSGVTTISTTCITVGSGTNRALALLCVFSGNALPSGLSVKWDSTGANQTMNQVGSAIANGTTDIAAGFAVVAPTSGLRNFAISWTGALELSCYLISFTGVNQTGGTTSFQGFTNTGTASNPASTGNITSNVADAICGIFADNNTQGSCTVSDLAFDTFTSGAGFDCNATYNVGTGTKALTGTWGSACNWGAYGMNISAAGAAPPPGPVQIGSFMYPYRRRVPAVRRTRIGWRKSTSGLWTPDKKIA